MFQLIKIYVLIQLLMWKMYLMIYNSNLGYKYMLRYLLRFGYKKVLSFKVNSLQVFLRNRNIIIPTPRLHHISSLNCPCAFKVSNSPTNLNVFCCCKATPIAYVWDLEKNLRNYRLLKQY